MPVFLRAFPLKDDSASVSKPRRPAERLREVRWQEDQTRRRARWFQHSPRSPRCGEPERMCAASVIYAALQ
jgi:hypothetical protein